MVVIALGSLDVVTCCVNVGKSPLSVPHFPPLKKEPCVFTQCLAEKSKLRAEQHHRGRSTWHLAFQRYGLPCLCSNAPCCSGRYDNPALRIGWENPAPSGCYCCG